MATAPARSRPPRTAADGSAGSRRQRHEDQRYGVGGDRVRSPAAARTTDWAINTGVNQRVLYFSRKLNAARRTRTMKKVPARSLPTGVADPAMVTAPFSRVPR